MVRGMHFQHNQVKDLLKGGIQISCSPGELSFPGKLFNLHTVFVWFSFAFSLSLERLSNSQDQGMSNMLFFFPLPTMPTLILPFSQQQRLGYTIYKRQEDIGTRQFPREGSYDFIKEQGCGERKYGRVGDIESQGFYSRDGLWGKK